MRITNCDELHPWRSTGLGPVPITPAADAPAPAQADCGLFSITMPTTLWPAPSTGVDGTTLGRTCRLTT
jgi:hypothetical protein